MSNINNFNNNEQQMIFCRACGKQHERNAELCPNCGKKNSGYFFKWQYALILIQIIMLLFIMFGTIQSCVAINRQQQMTEQMMRAMRI